MQKMQKNMNDMMKEFSKAKGNGKGREKDSGAKSKGKGTGDSTTKGKGKGKGADAPSHKGGQWDSCKSLYTCPSCGTEHASPDYDVKSKGCRKKGCEDQPKLTAYGKGLGYSEAMPEPKEPKAKAKAQPAKPPVVQDDKTAVPAAAATAQDDGQNDESADLVNNQLVVPPNKKVAKGLSKLVQVSRTLGIGTPEDVPDVGLALEKSPELKTSDKEAAATATQDAIQRLKGIPGMEDMLQTMEAKLAEFQKAPEPAPVPTLDETEQSRLKGELQGFRQDRLKVLANKAASVEEQIATLLVQRDEIAAKEVMVTQFADKYLALLADVQAATAVAPPQAAQSAPATVVACDLTEALQQFTPTPSALAADMQSADPEMAARVQLIGEADSEAMAFILKRVAGMFCSRAVQAAGKAGSPTEVQSTPNAGSNTAPKPDEPPAEPTDVGTTNDDESMTEELKKEALKRTDQDSSAWGPALRRPRVDPVLQQK